MNKINLDIMKNEVDAAIKLVRFLKKIGVYTSISEKPRCQKQKMSGRNFLFSTTTNIWLSPVAPISDP
jgi:hypothetical protein